MKPHNKAIGTTALALLVACLSFSSAPHLIAAVVKAALIQDVDEKGRIPYQKNFSFGCAFTDVCDVAGAAVPAGKRLVITHISGSTQSTGPNPAAANLVRISLLRQGDIEFAFAVSSYQGTSGGVNQHTTNEAMLAYFDSGQVPVVRLEFHGPYSNGSSVTLSGYLLDCGNSSCAPIAQ